jgi:hypothetical protein
VTDRTSTAVATRDGSLQATIAWLEGEFPGWEVSLDATTGWGGQLRPLWVARQPGQHPQAELSPAKLHTRLTDFLQREARRRALSN